MAKEREQREGRGSELSDLELAVVKAVPLPVDAGRVRVYRRDCRGTASRLRRIVLALSRNRAVALGNHVFLPDRCHGDLGVLAHELTHCGQYQAWGPARYFARGLAAQVRELLHRRFGIGTSPYHYQLTPGQPFEAYGIEQQAQLVEDRFRASGGGYARPSA